MYHKDSTKRNHKTKLVKDKQYDIMSSSRNEKSREIFNRKPYQIGADKNGKGG